MKSQWRDARRLGFEADAILRKFVLPNEGFVIAQGYRMTIKK
jgi:hypothetical protein